MCFVSPKHKAADVAKNKAIVSQQIKEFALESKMSQFDPVTVRLLQVIVEYTSLANASGGVRRKSLLEASLSFIESLLRNGTVKMSLIQVSILTTRRRLVRRDVPAAIWYKTSCSFPACLVRWHLLKGQIFLRLK